MEPITTLTNVEAAERCLNRFKNPTPSILVTFLGPVPEKVNLGTWGTYTTTTYRPNPLRCFKCQKFGHHSSRCPNTDICALCSGRHQTQLCLSKFKNGETIQAKCPNCKGGHHAWNSRCPARLHIIHGMEGATQPKPIAVRTAEQPKPAPKPQRPPKRPRQRTTSSTLPPSNPTPSPNLPNLPPPPPPTPLPTPPLPSPTPSAGFWAPPIPNPTPAPLTNTVQTEETITLSKSFLASLMKTFAISVASMLSKELPEEALNSAVGEVIKTATQELKHPAQGAIPKQNKTKQAPIQQSFRGNSYKQPQAAPRQRSVPKDLQHLAMQTEENTPPILNSSNFPTLPAPNPRDPRLNKGGQQVPAPTKD